VISPWDEQGFSSCSACPCYRAIATTPPECVTVSIRFRLPMLPSPYGCGLGLRGFSLSGPPMRSLSLRPGDSLTSLKDCFVDGLQTLGFPPICHPSYRASDSYPGRTDSCRTCQPLLDNITCICLDFRKSEEYVSQYSLLMPFIFPKFRLKVNGFRAQKGAST